MYRKSLFFLDQWLRKSSRKPLIIRGARQVGKTTLVELFCEENNLDLIKINIERHPIRSLESSFDVDAFLQEIKVLSGKSIQKNSLLFLDEIQASPKSIVMLRYLYEEKPELPIIAAGSLLEFLLNDFPYSMPVGRIEYLHLGPMDFEEFLRALNEQVLVGELREMPISETTFTQLEKRYREFLFVGGMPAAVKEYVATSDPNLVRNIHHEILFAYKEDINKYAQGQSILKTGKVLERIPGFIGRKIKYGELLPEYSSRDIRKSLDLLAQARIIHFCFHSNASGLPLKSLQDDHVYKIYFLDVGLYNSEMSTPWKNLIQSSQEELLNKGLICEQFIAQHLAYRSQGQEPPSLYYWLKDKSASKAEVDFVVEINGNIVPIEVKSGATGHLKSLSLFMAEKKLKKAYRFDLKYRKDDWKISAKVPLILGEQKVLSKYQLSSLPVFLINYFQDID